MPILVKDFTWSQTINAINIRIPLVPVYREKVDIFTTDKYIKAHFSPFLFEIFLLFDINSDKSKCTLQEDLIVFDLVKKEEVEWEQLERQLNKDEKAKFRADMLKECQEKAKQKTEERIIRKSQLDRFTVQQAMEIDNKQHTLMDTRRDEERNRAMNDLETWRRKAIRDKNNENNISNVSDTTSGVKIVELPDDVPKSGAKKAVNKPVKTPIKSDYIEKKKQEVENRVLPKLRAIGQVEIMHTPRTFPTPSRESTAQEEEAWLRNITHARRATGNHFLNTYKRTGRNT